MAIIFWYIESETTGKIYPNKTKTVYIDSLPVARGAKVAAPACISQKVFVTALLALHSCKTEMQVATRQLPKDHIGDLGSPETIARLITILPAHLQLLKVVLLNKNKKNAGQFVQRDHYMGK